MSKVHCAKHARYFHMCTACRAANAVAIRFTEPTKPTPVIPVVDSNKVDYIPCRPELNCPVCNP